MASKIEHQETAMPVASVTKPFEVTDQRFPIVGQDRDNPFKIAAFAVVAHCPTRGGRIARAESKEHNGAVTYSYWTVPAGRDEYPSSLVGSTDRGYDIPSAIEESRYNPHRRLHKVEPTAEQRELAEFARVFPHVAERLGLLQRPLHRHFDVGDCYKPVVCTPGPAAEINWQELIDKHASGDWGLYGQYRPEVLADQEAAFLVGLSPIDIRNTFATAGKFQVVRSAYEVPGLDGKCALIGTRLVGPDALTVCSLGPRQPTP